MGVSRYMFFMVDRILGQEMELRADAVAAEIMGASVGIRVLERLRNGIEPPLNKFVLTHPTNAERISQMQMFVRSVPKNTDVASE